MKDKLVCLVGESGSGKSTIAEMLEKEGYYYIQSYTTRKPRYEGERGHIFVSRTSKEALNIIKNDEFEMLPEMAIPSNFLANEVIGYTFFHNEHYWIKEKQYKNKKISVYVIDPPGVVELRQRIKDAEVIVIYLKCDIWIRAVRMKYRNNKNISGTNLFSDSWNYIDGDIKERILHDDEAFKIVQCNYVVDTNREIKEILRDIKNIVD